MRVCGELPVATEPLPPVIASLTTVPEDEFGVAATAASDNVVLADVA